VKAKIDKMKESRNDQLRQQALTSARKQSAVRDF